ncbi:hypothetical protein [Thiomicrorhabdus indica]|uniref:hypothetical protein n=1 Tax=Thiomicrorhabdus indica TaxID=2267253 RepID=UPI002AA6F2AF|nr:hypothetical protein [Thiomicrorhabdus indica]
MNDFYGLLSDMQPFFDEQGHITREQWDRVLRMNKGSRPYFCLDYYNKTEQWKFAESHLNIGHTRRQTAQALAKTFNVCLTTAYNRIREVTQGKNKTH